MKLTKKQLRYESICSCTLFALVPNLYCNSNLNLYRQRRTNTYRRVRERECKTIVVLTHSITGFFFVNTEICPEKKTNKNKLILSLSLIILYYNCTTTVSTTDFIEIRQPFM